MVDANQSLTAIKIWLLNKKLEGRNESGGHLHALDAVPFSRNESGGPLSRTASAHHAEWFDSKVGGGQELLLLTIRRK